MNIGQYFVGKWGGGKGTRLFRLVGFTPRSGKALVKSFAASTCRWSKPKVVAVQNMPWWTLELLTVAEANRRYKLR
jgi:hypothetical protein